MIVAAFLLAGVIMDVIKLHLAMIIDPNHNHWLYLVALMLTIPDPNPIINPNSVPR